MLWLPDAVWGIVFLTPCLLSKSCWQTSCTQSLDPLRQISLQPGAGGGVPNGRRLTDRGRLCPKPSDVGRGWGPPTSVPPLYPPPDAIPSVLPPYPTLSPQVVWGLDKGNHRRYLLEGLFAEVGQVIACMKSVSFLTPDMASKNDAIYGIV